MIRKGEKMKKIWFGLSVILLSGCCTYPKQILLLPNPYSQENLRQEQREQKQIELKEQLVELERQQTEYQRQQREKSELH